MAILSQDAGSVLFQSTDVGSGSTAQDAFNDAYQYTHIFEVTTAQVAQGVVLDWFLGDNSGGVSFELRRIAAVPEPNLVC